MEQRKYAKEVNIDVTMTSDNVLIGYKSDKLSFNGTTYYISKTPASTLQALRFGQQWFDLDPYSSYHRARFQSKQLPFSSDMDSNVTKSKLNTLNELLLTCFELFVPVTLSLHVDDRSQDFAE